MRGATALLVVAFTTVAGTALAQDAPMPKLTGVTWQRIYVTDESGVAQPGAPQPYLIFSPDGFYMQVGFRADRPKLTKPFTDLRKADLLAQRRGAGARVGRYSLVGNRLSRTFVTSLTGESEETTAQIQDVHMSGDTLFFQSVGTRGESRWRKAR